MMARVSCVSEAVFLYAVCLIIICYCITLL